MYSSTACAITHYLAQNPAVQSKLQVELDEALGHEDDPVAPWAIVKSLPYLDAVVNEGLRLFSAFSTGLPRVAPEGGLYVSGKFFSEGTVLSIPICTIHRDPEIWGNDAEAFRPERWFELDQARIQEIFYPFSHGPRSVELRNRSSG
jgi:benzoate 4-monooxygenase